MLIGEVGYLRNSSEKFRGQLLFSTEKVGICHQNSSKVPVGSANKQKLSEAVVAFFPQMPFQIRFFKNVN